MHPWGQCGSVGQGAVSNDGKRSIVRAQGGGGGKCEARARGACFERAGARRTLFSPVRRVAVSCSRCCCCRDLQGGGGIKQGSNSLRLRK